MQKNLAFIVLTSLLSLLILLVITTTAGAYTLQDEPGFEPSACPFDLPIGLEEGRDLICGYMTVPEDHSNPDGPTIRLAVAILKSPDPNPSPDPLFIAQGGPGGSTIDTYLEVIPSSRLRNHRDIVLFDRARHALFSASADLQRDRPVDFGYTRKRSGT